MTDYLEMSNSIKSEADFILKERGLLSILAKYGNPKFAGSYYLNLMMKRDLDISMITENISVNEFFSLGSDISELLNPHSMFYRNTRIKFVKNRPIGGLYWGVQFEDWNLDIWAVSREEYDRSEVYMNKIKTSLNSANRNVILKLKYELLNSGEYGKTCGSKELYDSVLYHGVMTTEDLGRYLQKGYKQERK